MSVFSLYIFLPFNLNIGLIYYFVVKIHNIKRGKNGSLAAITWYSNVTLQHHQIDLIYSYHNEVSPELIVLSLFRYLDLFFSLIPFCIWMLYILCSQKICTIQYFQAKSTIESINISLKLSKTWFSFITRSRGITFTGL